MFTVVVCTVLITLGASVQFPPCDTVCGVKTESIVAPPRQLPHHALQLNGTNNFCGPSPYRRWKNLGAKLMRSLGSKDRYRCVQYIAGDPPKHVTRNTTVWEYLWQPYRYLSAYGKSVLNGDYEMKAQKVDPVDIINAVCIVDSDRGVFDLQPNVSMNASITNLTWIIRLPMQKRGSLFSLVNAKTRQVENVTMKSKTNDTCANTTSCKQWKTFLFSKRRSKYSMFADFELAQVPGVQRALQVLKQKQETVESVEEDVTISNLAILCLPLIMSIPPISLLESVSTGAVIAYVVATDVLAVCPCLIKGIELLVSSRGNSASEAYAQLTLLGKKSGAFERWYVRCESIRPQKLTLAIGLMGIAVWFMFASTLTEFLFWRASKRRQKPNRCYALMNNGDSVAGSPLSPHTPSHFQSPMYCHCCGTSLYSRDNSYHLLGPAPVPAPAAIDMDTPATNSESNRPRAAYGRLIRETLWDGKRKIIILLLIPLTAFYVTSIIFTRFYLDIGTVVSLTILHIYSTNRQIRLYTIVGFVIGVTSGPLHLVLQMVHGGIRESEKWKQVSEGANIGAGTIAMTAYIILTTHHVVRIPSSIVFAWVYGVGLIVLLMIRNRKQTRQEWEDGVVAFALGMLFGPFGALFVPLFRDVEIEPRVKSHIYEACSFGFIFCVTIVTVATIVLGPGLKSTRNYS